MRVFHNSRDTEYRSPYGAVVPGTRVTLSIDVWGAPDAKATLRTWTNGVGEGLYAMMPADLPQKRGEAKSPCEEAPVRLSVEFTPEKPGIVWYHFIIESPDGSVKRYGAQDDLMGGEGALRDWEPPSFQLSVSDPLNATPAWYEPIGDYLGNANAKRNLLETVETLRENYPKNALDKVFPWGYEEIGLHDASQGPVVRAPEPANAEAPAISCPRPLDVGGDFPCFSAGDDVFGFWLRDASGGIACALVNTAPHQPHDVRIPRMGEVALELLDGREVAGEDSCPPELLACSAEGIARAVRIHLREGGSALVYFPQEERLGQLLEPGLGVLAHITSLPGRRGTLGAPARSFVDWLVEADARYWQILPVNPTDDHGSPYAGISAFAGNTRLLSGGEKSIRTQLDKLDSSKEYRSFCEREHDWLEPYACFMAIREKLGSDDVWQEWPEQYRHFDPSLIERDASIAAYAEECRRMQFLFDCQWRKLRAYANERGIRIVGDIPIYVSSDSADVWAHPELFQLDGDGMPLAVAGCPPDAFTEDGQVWGNPLYNWQVMESDGYAWWLRRLERTFSLYDYVRLDHFIGFSRYFSIPSGHKAQDGTYKDGPGLKLFGAAYDAFGKLPIIAEDLGLITPGVRALIGACGFPGMDIVQFADGNDPLSGYFPRPEKIVYTGTHDNQTLVGYACDRYGRENGPEIAEKLARLVAGQPAPICVLPLQDLALLDDTARMNTPGTTEGNWSWQATAANLSEALPRARELAAVHRDALQNHAANPEQ